MVCKMCGTSPESNGPGAQKRRLGVCVASHPGGGFEPLIRTLQVWLDAADAGTIERDEAGLVATWKDKSGHDRHAA